MKDGKKEEKKEEKEKGAKVFSKRFNKKPRCSNTNDASWYYTNEQMKKDTYRLSFPEMLGNNLELGVPNNSFSSVPGIQTIHLEQSLGVGTEANDAPNVISRQNYIFVRHANSGSANYEAPDLQMMTFAWSSAMTWLMSLRRVYGALFTYAVRNRYFGKALVEALGFDYSDLELHTNDLRSLINLNALKLGTIKIPSGSPYLARWLQLTSHVYIDRDGERGQIYAFVFDRFMKYSGFTSSTGTELLFEEASPRGLGRLLTFSDIQNITNNLLNPILNDEDVGTMSGDIMKAFKEDVSGTFQIDEGYQLEVFYDEGVLSQIHNSASLFFGEDVNGTPTFNHTVKQEGGLIKEVMTITHDADAPSDGKATWIATGNVFLDYYWGDVSEEDVAEGTRLIYTSTQSSNIELVDSCNSEIVLYRQIITLRDGSVVKHPVATWQSSSSISSLTATCLNSNFDWAPLIFLTDGSSSMYPLYGIIGDIDTYTLTNRDVIKKMNRNAIFALLCRNKLVVPKDN